MITISIYWVSVFCIFHTYLLFPIILKILSKGKNDNEVVFQNNDPLPFVSILMSLFNEETVIVQKIESVIKSNYPPDRIEMIIGSDASTDRTNEIVEQITQKYFDLISFYPFQQRQGKANIINQLSEKTKGQILILTDANVIFDKETVFELVKHFKNPQIGLVDSHMKNYGLKKNGISIQENAYISREVELKNEEGRIWGAMMGPFGGGYAIRRELFFKIPPNFLVDDFYINMKILEKGFKAINNPQAFVYEDVSNNLYIEFKRKIRIATGNFQNLKFFAFLLFPLTKGLAFCFLSHKVLRWIAPIFLITALISNILLASISFYKILLVLYLFTFIIPIIDGLLRKLQIDITLVRFFTHFYSMNIALLLGFFKYLKGVKSNVWQPTKRHQG